jgi:hypothetical protein
MCKSGCLYKFSYCTLLVVGLLLSSKQVVRGETVEKDAPYELGILDYLKGKPTENQMFIGMFTCHFDPKSRESRNWQQNLIGLQYNDFFACTFENSFYSRTWAAGIARTLHTQVLSNHWDMAAGYRLGVVYGYQEGQAPFSSLSPVIPVVEQEFRG